MAILDGVKSVFIRSTLERILDGNTGSNILGAILTAVLAANINFMKAVDGFKFDSADNAQESAKLVTTTVLALFAYFVGKHKAPGA